MKFSPYNLYESKLLASAEYNIKDTGYRPPPKPSLNGGLYTGEPFEETELHRNFPVQPDSVNYHINNLKSANPPPGALYQFPDTIRPGNNLPDTVALGLSRYSTSHSIMCTKRPVAASTKYDCHTGKAGCEDFECQKNNFNKGFSKHAYL